jgi:hypothetical protein
MNLLNCIGDIYDIFLVEAETADIAAEIAAAKKRKRRNATLAAAGAVGIAFAVWVVKTKRGMKKTA